MITPTTSTGSTGAFAAPDAPTASGGRLAQFARLVRWELFLARRRRAMLITLAALLLVGYALVILVEYAIYFSAHTDLATRPLGEALAFPGAIGVGGAYIADAGVLLFVVLAGALIGSEYSYSTLRLSLARGVGRGQLLAAQIVSLALLTLAMTALALLLSGLVGLIGSALGVSQAPSGLSGGLLVEIPRYWLALSFNIFAYALISLWVGTLTRSVAGAIAGPLVFIVIEVVTTDLLTAVGGISLNNPLLNAITHSPSYLLGVNTNALITWAGAAPYPFTPGSAQVGVWHALIVSVAYCAVFILISYLALRNRDVLE